MVKVITEPMYQCQFCKLYYETEEEARNCEDNCVAEEESLIAMDEYYAQMEYEPEVTYQVHSLHLKKLFEEVDELGEGPASQMAPSIVFSWFKDHEETLRNMDEEVRVWDRE